MQTINDIVQIPNPTDENIAAALAYKATPPAQMTPAAASIALPSGVVVVDGTKDELMGLADYVLSTMSTAQAATSAALAAQIAALEAL